MNEPKPIQDITLLRNTHPDDHTNLLILLGSNQLPCEGTIQRVNAIPHSTTMERTSNSIETNRIPFVVTFNLALTNIPKIIQRYVIILHSSKRYKEAFPFPPLIFYHRSKNFRDILIGAEHHRPSLQSPGTFHCKRNWCKTCPFIKEETTSYTFFSTGEQHQIQHHITCTSTITLTT